MDQRFVELQLLWIIDLVEFYHEVTVEIEEDGDSFDEFLNYFEGALRFNDGGFSEGLFEIVDDFVVAFLSLLHIFALSGLIHNITSCPRIIK